MAGASIKVVSLSQSMKELVTVAFGVTDCGWRSFPEDEDLKW